jgi:hypothetical protein
VRSSEVGSVRGGSGRCHSSSKFTLRLALPDPDDCLKLSAASEIVLFRTRRRVPDVSADDYQVLLLASMPQRADGPEHISASASAIAYILSYQMTLFVFPWLVVHARQPSSPLFSSMCLPARGT